jgi:hypothetical protein
MKSTRSLRAFLSLFALLLASLIPAPAAQEKPADSMIGSLQSALNAKDRAAYLALFTPDLRDQEAVFFDDVFDRMRMDRVSIRRTTTPVPGSPSAPFFLQAFFENAYAALEEAWQVSLVPAGAGWVIGRKQTVGDVTSLYRVVIPGERVEKGVRVEVECADIRLSFTEATVFYDNIPDLETALVILGKGRVQYGPSLESERHQLELALGKPRLNETLRSLYLRGSPSFFRDHVHIEGPAGGRSGTVSRGETERAAAIFQKDYSRSFTVENPFNRQFYTVLPQSDEAVLELETGRGRAYTYIHSPFFPEAIHFIDRDKERLINLYSPPEEPGQKRLLLSFGRPFDIQRYELDVDFTPSDRYFSVKARLEITSGIDHLASLKLVLNPCFEIVHLFDGSGRELFYTRDRLRSLLYVYLIDSVARGESLSLDVYYRGKLEPAEATTDVLSISQSAPTTFSLIPVIYDTYFYTHSSRWYPGAQDDDYFTARLRVIIPPEYTCVAGGTLVSREPLNNVQTVEGIEKVGRPVYTFDIKIPVKNLSFIAGRMTREETAASDPKGSFYSVSSPYLRSQGTWPISRDVLRFYQDYFGGFPYDKLDVVLRLWPSAGGSSPASFIVLNEIPRPADSRIVLNANSPVDFARWQEYFVAHEIAHQWWGQAVSWDTYHDQWLSEGLAQMSSFLYLGQRYGDKTTLSILKRLCQWTRKDSVWGAITLGSRLSLRNFSAFQAIVYDKSALALFMLRDILGPETFRAGLREFFESSKFQAARTAQFFKAMARVSGRDLEAFARGWFSSYTLPEVKLTWSNAVRDGQSVLRLSVEQAKDVFVFPLTLQWKEAGRVVRRKIVVEDRSQAFEFPLSAPAQKLKADPDQVFPGRVDVVR